MNDPHITGLSVHGFALIAALELWATRDDPNPDHTAYSAGHVAVQHIDGMMRELHQLRARLVTENRQFQDAAMASVDELLARTRPVGEPAP